VTELIIIAGVITWCALAALYMFITNLVRFPECTVDDVAQFLRPVDLEQAEMLLDPGIYHSLRWNSDPDTLLEIQRKRARIYLELLHRMAHNARVLVELGRRQMEEAQSEKEEAISRLQTEAVNVRVYCFVIILKLRILLAIRPMQAPSLIKCRRVVDLDGIASYKALRQASTALFEEFRRPLDELTLSF
jgi:hypothetical protein